MGDDRINVNGRLKSANVRVQTERIGKKFYLQATLLQSWP